MEERERLAAMRWLTSSSIGIIGWLAVWWSWLEASGERLSDAIDDSALRRDAATGEAAMVGGSISRREEILATDGLAMG